MIKPQAGFTIVELLIVIVVIAILAAISVVAYNGIRERAQVTSLKSTLVSIEKGLKLKAVDDGVSAWWMDGTLGGNPSLATLVANTNFKNYYQIENTPVGSNSAWFYDNDGDTYPGCSTGSSGVNIIAYNQAPNLALWTAVDREIDDGNIACGKLRYNSSDSGGAIYWSFALNSATNI